MRASIPEPRGKPEAKRSRARQNAQTGYTYIPPTEQQHGHARPLSKSELCEYLNCSPKYIEQEVSRGHLQATKLSHRMVRYTWPAIERWLASKAV